MSAHDGQIVFSPAKSLSALWLCPSLSVDSFDTSDLPLLSTSMMSGWKDLSQWQTILAAYCISRHLSPEHINQGIRASSHADKVSPGRISSEYGWSCMQKYAICNVLDKQPPPAALQRPRDQPRQCAEQCRQQLIPAKMTVSLTPIILAGVACACYIYPDPGYGGPHVEAALR